MAIVCYFHVGTLTFSNNHNVYNFPSALSQLSLQQTADTEKSEIQSL